MRSALMPHGRPRSLTEYANLFERSLRSQVFPYWYGTCDKTNGGYILSDYHRGIFTPLHNLRRRLVPPIVDKMIVSQSRLVYVFSLAHRLGYTESRHDYVTAAEHGYRFLTDCMFDSEHGAFNWSVARDGKLLDGRKFLYGQAIAIYGLVEYYRATGLTEPLEYAARVFKMVNQKIHDDKNLGWLEHADADWKILDRDSSDNVVDVVGLKSSDAHLHWMEALCELYDVTRNTNIRRRLEETLKINSEFFFPRDVDKSIQFSTRDWRVVKIPGRLDISYGHLVEFAWLMIRAQQALGIPPTWDHFNAMLDYSLEFGFDHRRGGFYDRGNANQPAQITEKFWWVQAEGLAALCDALKHQSLPKYESAMTRLLDWIFKHQMLLDGIWIGSTDEAGYPINRIKAGQWKAAYHEVRAMSKFIDAFSKS